MVNGWALGKFAGEFAQVTQTYTASHVRLWPIASFRCDATTCPLLGAKRT